MRTSGRRSSQLKEDRGGTRGCQRRASNMKTWRVLGTTSYIRDVGQHRLRSLLSCAPNWASLPCRLHHPISSLVGIVVGVDVARRLMSCATLRPRSPRSVLMRHARLRAHQRVRIPAAAHVGIGFAGPHSTGKSTWSRSPAPQARYRASRRPWSASEPSPLARIPSPWLRQSQSLSRAFMSSPAAPRHRCRRSQARAPECTRCHLATLRA